MAEAKKDYVVTVSRFIGGQYRKVDDPIQMTERAAKYYMEPHGTGLRPAKVAKKRTEDQPEKTAK